MGNENQDHVAHVYRATYHEDNEGWWEMKREEVAYEVGVNDGWWYARIPHLFHNGKTMVSPPNIGRFVGNHVGEVTGTPEHLAVTLQDRNDAKAWELFDAFLKAEEVKVIETAFMAKVRRVIFQGVKPQPDPFTPA